VGVSSEQKDDHDVESAVQDQSLNGIRAGVGFSGSSPFKRGRGERFAQSLNLLTPTIAADDQDATIRHRDRDSAGSREPVHS